MEALAGPSMQKALVPSVAKGLISADITMGHHKPLQCHKKGAGVRVDAGGVGAISTPVQHGNWLMSADYANLKPSALPRWHQFISKTATGQVGNQC